MANDRIFLVCSDCNAWKMLYKFYPGGGYTGDSEPLTAWIDEHLHDDLYANVLANEHFWLMIEGNPHLARFERDGTPTGGTVSAHRGEETQ